MKYMNYEHFLFSQLYLSHNPSVETYDRLFATIQAEYARFTASPYNDNEKGLYDCVEAFLKHDPVKEFCDKTFFTVNLYALIGHFDFVSYGCPVDARNTLFAELACDGKFWEAHDWGEPESVELLNEDGNLVNALNLLQDTDVDIDKVTPIFLASLVLEENLKEEFMNLDFSSLINL